jgi:haloacetate dehalogenase
MTPADIAEYVRAYQQPGAIMVACNDYRAGPQDLAQDNADEDVRVRCPALALWGADFEWVGKAYGVAQIWSEIADDLRTAVMPDCWHLPHEERPAEVNEHLLAFLGEAEPDWLLGARILAVEHTIRRWRVRTGQHASQATGG